MLRFVILLCCTLLPVFTSAQPTGSPTPSNPVEKVRALFKEKSWQLAITAADEVDTSTLTIDARREILYLKARSLKQLNGYDPSSIELLRSIIAENPADVWAGRAHWRLQPGLEDGQWLDTSTTDPLKDLRSADRILSDFKADDLQDFYLSVINSNMIMQTFPAKTDRDYLLSYFDKIVPLISSNNDQLATVQLRRQQVLNAQYPDRTDTERLSGLRGMVTEFPKTRAAAQAQWMICQHYINRNEFDPALYELNLLANQFAGSDEAREATREIERIKRPDALFALPSQYLPGEKIQFELTARNTDSVKFTALPIDLVKELQKYEGTRPDLQAVSGKPAFSDSISIDRKDGYLPTTRTVTLDFSKPGAYVLRAEAGGKIVCNSLLIISDLTIVGNLGPAGYEFWTVHAKTGKPVPGSNITVAHTIKSENKWLTGKQVQFFSEFTPLVSNQDGFADFKPGEGSGQMFAVATRGDSVAFMENLYWSPFYYGGEDQPQSYVYTDRPAYRPEQVVYWRAIVRNRKNGQYDQLPKGNLQATIRDSQGQEVFNKSDLSLSEYGTIQGELTLPAGTPLGEYSISIMRPSDQRQLGNGAFRVEEYKKPEFEVSVAAADDFARVGQPVKARVEARYLFGSPVTDAKLTYTVRRRPRYQVFWENLSWHLDDRDLGWFEETPDRPSTLHGSQGTIVAQGEGKLDSSGNYTLTFDSTVPDSELNQVQQPISRGWYRQIWPPSPRVWDFQVEVTVTDASRRNIDASQVIPVGLKSFKLAAKTQRTIVTPGDNARVELKSLNLADKPVPSSGTLYIEKLVWNEKDQQDDITTVSSQAVSIEASGSLLLNWRVPDDLRGSLRFAYITEDPFGGQSVAYASFFAASPEDTDIQTRYQGIEFISDQSRYQVGDTARIMVLSEYKDAYIWYWEDTGSGNLNKKVLPLPHRTNFIAIPITQAYVPNTMLHLAAVRDKLIITDEVELIVPPTSRVLNVEVTPATSQVQPGEAANVTILATDENGQPVSGEFSLSIFDDAVTYIAPDTRDDIRKFFYGMKRPLRSDVRVSLDSSANYGGSLFPDALRYLQAGMPGDNRHAYFNRVGGSAGSLRSISRRDSAPSGSPELAMDMAASSRIAPAAPAMAPAPMFAMQEASVAKKAESKDEALGFAEKKKQFSEMEQPAIRADFRDSMFWSPTIITDADGSATISIKYPDSLTTWKMTAVGLTPDTRVGNATTETVARKKVLARLQAPRFFRERDQLVITANLHNYTDSPIDMEATLRAKGISIADATTMPLHGDTSFTGNARQVTVPAGGELRVDWNVKVESAAAGDAILNLMALSAAGSDSMQTTVPLLPHGIDKFVAWNGTSRDESSTGVAVQQTATSRIITQTVSIPSQRIRETTRLNIQLNPSLASSIRESIPYMIEYPYGCVEQTMSRFLPAVVASRAFQVLGYPLDPSLQEKLPEVTTKGLKRLQDMQLPGGGWGWWAGDSENLQITSYVMYGFTLAREAEVTVDSTMFDRGLRRLATLRDEATSRSAKDDTLRYWYHSDLHSLMYAEYVLTLNGQSSARTLDYLWQHRDKLTARGLAMLARTLARLNRQQDAEVVLRNMMNVAVVTPENNTRRWGKLQDAWWWYDDAVESTAVGLMAYLDIKPDDPAVEQAMKWLVLNRQGRRWKSTRDSSYAVLALTQYMLQKKEAAKPVSIEVRVGDKLIRSLNVTPDNFWSFDGNITLRGSEIPDGDFPVSFTVAGEGAIYYSIYAEYFTLEEGIKAAGNEIYVTRSYEKLQREQTTETVNGKPTTTYKDSWLPLKDGDNLNSGDEIRVTLQVKSLNDYEYVVFEDPKPAGMEPVDLQSGSRYGNGLCSNMELRDKWIAFFITTLKQGTHAIRYNLRAEIPGTFHTMPATGYAMYYPPLRTNSDEFQVTVKD